MTNAPQHPAMEWYPLLSAAKDAATRAYAPYSNYHVGAAALMTDGSIVSGANVENASYGLTLCAECSVVAQAATSRHGRIERLVCLISTGEIIPPCGRCRQIIAEHASPEFVLLCDSGELTLEQMLPWGFSPAQLDGFRRPNS